MLFTRYELELACKYGYGSRLQFYMPTRVYVMQDCKAEVDEGDRVAKVM